MSSMFLNIVSTFKGDGLNAATRQLGAFGKQAGGLGGTLGKVGAALASFGLATKAVQFTSQSIDSARDLERNLFSIKTVFDDLAPSMIAFTKRAENIGLSQKDAAKASTFLGSVLKQSGFEMGFVQKETEKLVTLAQDLATTYGYDVQEALLGMTALFRGEYDPIEKFGVAMKQSEINSELAAKGLDKLEGAARRNAEQTVRLELLYQRAADASGAFTAQSGNLYVEQKKLSAAWENMQATVGTQLLPAMGELVDALKPLVDELTPRLVQVVNDAKPGLEVFTQLIRDIGDTSTTTGATVSFFADVLGQLFRLISENFGVLLQLATLIFTVNTALRLVSATLMFISAHPVIAGLTLLAGAFILINDRANNLKYTVDTTGRSVTSFKTALKDTAKESSYVSQKYGVVATTFQKASKEAQRLAGEVAAADRAKLGNLRDEINQTKISATAAANEIKRMARYAGIDLAEPAAVEPISTATATTSGTKAGKAAGKAFADSASKTISKYQQQINDAIEKSLASVPMQDTWKESGNTIGNSIISGIQKSFTEIGKLGPRLVNEYGKQLKVIYDRTAKLQEAFIARTDFQVKLKQDIMGMFDFKTIKTGLSGIIKQFKDQVEQTRKFRDNLAELQKLGLSGDLFRQIAEGQDFNTAAELVKGGAAAVNEVNSLFGSLTGFADEIATISGNSLYNLGVDAATGYVRTLEDGFADLQRQQKLESQKALLNSTIQSISSKLAGGMPAEQRAILEAQLKAALESRNNLFGEGGAKTGGRFGRETRNLGIRTGLDQYFLGGGQMNSNIANQLAYLNLGSTAASVADREARALQRAQGRAAAQGISVNVNGGISTSAQIGQAVIDAIRAYERASGQVYARA